MDYNYGRGTGMDIKIEFAYENELENIEQLSKEFELEDCCNGIIADSKEDLLKKNIVVAKVDGEIIGYCYGSEEIKNRDTSFFKKGQKSFYIEEMYIKPQYRNKRIGTLLFNFIQDYAKSLGCELLETTAVSKDYEALLNFYINNMNMEFWTASLIKKIN